MLNAIEFENTGSSKNSYRASEDINSFKTALNFKPVDISQCVTVFDKYLGTFLGESLHIQFNTVERKVARTLTNICFFPPTFVSVYSSWRSVTESKKKANKQTNQNNQNGGKTCNFKGFFSFSMLVRRRLIHVIHIIV